MAPEHQNQRDASEPGGQPVFGKQLQGNVVRMRSERGIRLQPELSGADPEQRMIDDEPHGISREVQPFIDAALAAIDDGMDAGLGTRPGLFEKSNDDSRRLRQYAETTLIAFWRGAISR